MGMEDIESQLKSLEAVAVSCVECGETGRLFNEITRLSALSSDIGVDLEIVFRSILEGYMTRSSLTQAYIAKDTIVKLLQCAIDIGLKCAELSPNFPKLPFLLIEDILDRQTLSHAASTWEVVESMVDTLTLPDLFNRGKFVILRTCNSLLKRLSKSCHTEFCGRVLMFLAAIYPLSERSAVNLMGKVNTGNITGYEDENQYLDNRTQPKDEDANGAEAEETNGSEVMEEAEEGEEASSRGSPVAREDCNSVTNGDRLPKGENGVIDYDYGLYKTFWDIQRYLSSDPKSLDAQNIWTEILSSANAIIATFEAHAFCKSELQQARERRIAARAAATGVTTADSSSGDSESDHLSNSHVYMGCKYLTSSQLFALELKDPSIRQQVCVQLLILIHHKLRVLASLPEALPPAPVLTSKKAPPPQATTNKQPTEKELIGIEKRIMALIESTPPSGEDLAMTLRMIFDGQREARWMQWKNDHCPAYEKAPLPVPTEEERSATRAAIGNKKRKATDNLTKPLTDADYYFDHQLEDMQRAAKSLSEEVPALDIFVEDYLEAEDPEAGIEEEYHPKNDTVYCWRARRLIAHKKLSAFENMGDGSVGKGLASLFPGRLATPVNKDSAGESKSSVAAPDKEDDDAQGGVDSTKVSPCEADASTRGMRGKVSVEDNETTSGAARGGVSGGVSLTAEEEKEEGCVEE